MRIKKITSTGLKRDFSIDLTGEPLMLVGPNGSGKSSVLDALRFAILGNIPSIGKRHQDTAKAMSGNEINVSIELEDGRVFNRSLRRSRSNLTASADCSWLRNATPAEHSKEITKLFGAEDNDVAEILDIKQSLLDISPAKRAARIEELVGGGQKTSKQIAEAVAEMTVRRLTGHEDDELKHYKDLLPIVTDAERDLLKSSAGYIQSAVEDAGISRVIDWAKNLKNESNSSLHSGEEACKEIEARLQSLANDIDTDTLAPERDRLQREFGAIRERVSEHKSKLDTLNNLDLEIQSVQNLMTNCANVDQEIPEVSPPSITEGQVEEARQEWKKAAANLADVQNALRESVEKRKNLEVSLALVRDQIKSANDNPLRQVANAIGACESCREWVATVLTYLNDDPDELAKEEQRIVQEIESLPENEDPEPYAQKEQVLKDVYDAMGRQIYKEQQEYDQYRKAVSAQSGYEQEHSRLAEKLQDLQSKRNAFGTLEPVYDNRIKIQDRIDEINAALDEAARVNAVRRELETIQSQIESRRTARDVYTAIEWAAKRVRESEVSDAADPLTSRIDTFLKNAGTDLRSYIKADAKACDIGWVCDSEPIPVETMSGGEWQLFTTALIAAMVEIREPEVPILISEFGECDESRLRLLRMALSEFNGTVIGATHLPLEFYGMQTIPFGIPWEESAQK